ncbi:MAG: GTPase Era [Prochlorococcaceae cyanobacterium]
MDPHPFSASSTDSTGNAQGRLGMPAGDAGVLLPIPDPAESARLLASDTLGDTAASDTAASDAATDDAGAAAPFRSGFVALIGRPNVGKSTLLNQLVGQKVAITSPVAQTTRHRLRAILTTPAAQLVLLDTPGIHKPHHLLGERLVKAARSAIGDVDVVLLLVDGSENAGRGDGFIVELLRHCRHPVHVALNKWDQVAPAQAENLEDSYRQLLAGDGEGPPLTWPLHRVSALSGEGTADLVQALGAALPPGGHLYPPDTVSDQPEQVLMAELVREQVLSHTREEVPHSVAVSIDRVVDDGPRTAVLATVVVERASQKGILIGKGGRMLRTIGQGARLQMEKLLGGPVYLELFVKVVPGWRRSAARLTELGYRGD